MSIQRYHGCLVTFGCRRVTNAGRLRWYSYILTFWQQHISATLNGKLETLTTEPLTQITCTDFLEQVQIRLGWTGLCTADETHKLMSMLLSFRLVPQKYAYNNPKQQHPFCLSWCDIKRAHACLLKSRDFNRLLVFWLFSQRKRSRLLVLCNVVWWLLVQRCTYTSATLHKMDFTIIPPHFCLCSRNGRQADYYSTFFLHLEYQEMTPCFQATKEAHMSINDVPSFFILNFGWNDVQGNQEMGEVWRRKKSVDIDLGCTVATEGYPLFRS